MSNSKEPLKKYQSLLMLKKDIESSTSFRTGSDAWEQEYTLAWWDQRGLWLTKCYMSEEDATAFAHWILRMTQEETYNNE